MSIRIADTAYRASMVRKGDHFTRTRPAADGTTRQVHFIDAVHAKEVATVQYHGRLIVVETDGACKPLVALRHVSVCTYQPNRVANIVQRCRDFFRTILDLSRTPVVRASFLPEDRFFEVRKYHAERRETHIVKRAPGHMDTARLDATRSDCMRKSQDTGQHGADDKLGQLCRHHPAFCFHALPRGGVRRINGARK